MLEINNLVCGYDSQFVLNDINLRIKDGEYIGIIGPNGSGKTTFLRAVTKILRPRKGRILFEGENIECLSHGQLARRIAVASQYFEPGLKMSVEEFVLLGRTPHRKKWQFWDTGIDEEIAERAMAMAEIIQFKDRPIDSLSAGERQMMVISRALAQEPRLLLLDEPTSHLDIAHQVRILDLIKRLNKKNGLTVIIVLHDLNLASEYCDRLILLNNGRVHKMGAPDEVLTYQVIEEVYKTIVVVENNPISSKPYILLVSEEDKLQTRLRQKGGSQVLEKTFEDK